MNVKERKDIADAMIASVGWSDQILDALDDAIGGVGVQDAEGDGVGQAEGTISTVAL